MAVLRPQDHVGRSRKLRGLSGASVVEENGVLVDITPTRASRRYPFIRHEGGEKDFITFVESGVMCIEFVAP